MEVTPVPLNRGMGVRMKTVLVVLLQSLVLTVFFTMAGHTYETRKPATTSHVSAQKCLNTFVTSHLSLRD
jgi:hypothetical protein